MRIYKSWTELKEIFIEKELLLQYHEYDYKYLIFATEADSIEYYTELWKDPTKVKGIDVEQNDLDKADFETNYKADANQTNVTQVIVKTGDITVEGLEKRTKYKSEILTPTDSEQVFELLASAEENPYLDFIIKIEGEHDVIIKLNDSENDEILLQGKNKGRDEMGVENFALHRIYYKRAEAGNVSLIHVFATKP